MSAQLKTRPTAIAARQVQPSSRVARRRIRPTRPGRARASHGVWCSRPRSVENRIFRSSRGIGRSDPDEESALAVGVGRYRVGDGERTAEGEGVIHREPRQRHRRPQDDPAQARPGADYRRRVEPDHRGQEGGRILGGDRVAEKDADHDETAGRDSLRPALEDEREGAEEERGHRLVRVEEGGVGKGKGREGVGGRHGRARRGRSPQAHGDPEQQDHRHRGGQRHREHRRQVGGEMDEPAARALAVGERMEGGPDGHGQHGQPGRLLGIDPAAEEGEVTRVVRVVVDGQ